MNVGEVRCAVGLLCMPENHVAHACVIVNGSHYSGEIKSLSFHEPPVVTFKCGDLVRVLGLHYVYDCRLCQTGSGTFQLIHMESSNRMGEAVKPCNASKITVAELSTMISGGHNVSFEKIAG